MQDPLLFFFSAVIYVALIIFAICYVVKFWQACNNVEKITEDVRRNATAEFIRGNVDEAVKIQLDHLALELVPYFKELSERDMTKVQDIIDESGAFLAYIGRAGSLPQHLSSAEAFAEYIGK